MKLRPQPTITLWRYNARLEDGVESRGAGPVRSNPAQPNNPLDSLAQVLADAAEGDLALFRHADGRLVARLRLGNGTVSVPRPILTLYLGDSAEAQTTWWDALYATHEAGEWVDLLSGLKIPYSVSGPAFFACMWPFLRPALSDLPLLQEALTALQAAFQGATGSLGSPRTLHLLNRADEATWEVLRSLPLLVTRRAVPYALRKAACAALWKLSNPHQYAQALFDAAQAYERGTRMGAEPSPGKAQWAYRFLLWQLKRRLPLSELLRLEALAATDDSSL